MTRDRDTLDEASSLATSEPERTRPAVVVIFSGATPLVRVEPVGREPLVLGRGQLPDERLSREHAEIKREGGRWIIRDCDSKNGTFVDGKPVHGSVTVEGRHVLRLGHTVCLLSDAHGDGQVIVNEKMVVGRALRNALDTIRRFASSSETLLITGESGSGKELAAHTFHSGGPHRRGPFVAVNCATIPTAVAERLLFGTRRGAYSGADADAEGYVQAADQGVLFLDEVAELDADVQAKLLRVLESHEVLPLGATSPKKVDVRICFATHRNLRTAVADGKFRADLFYRIAGTHVALPPLRERPEEIPFLVARELGELQPHAKLVEACVMRPWPGNVRELLGALRAAVQRAMADGSQIVRLRHLDDDAGMPIATPASSSEPDRPGVEKALAENGGNIAATARALGLHRTQLYRLMKKLGIEPT